MKYSSEIPWTQLASGFFNTIYLSDDSSTVIKVPKLTTHLIGETKEKLRRALEIHITYLWDAVPETQIKDSKISPLGYIIEQAYCPWVQLDSAHLMWPVKAEWVSLLNEGFAMEENEKLFFDMYGRKWVLHAIPQTLKKDFSLLFTNIILTPEQRLKYIDISLLSTKNLLVQSAKVCRDYLNAYYLKEKST